MYKDLNRYLEPGLDLKNKRQRGFEVFVAKAYHSSTEKFMKKAIDQIKNVKTPADFHLKFNSYFKENQVVSVEEAIKNRKQERVNYWKGVSKVGVGYLSLKTGKKYFKKVNEESRKQALEICEFMLKNIKQKQKNIIALGYRKYYAKNTDKANSRSKVAGKKRKLRCVNWLTKEQKDYMDAVHVEARALRKGGLNVHVDHIIPLCGEKISGLHVPENIEIVPGDLNLEKNNKWEVA